MKNLGSAKLVPIVMFSGLLVALVVWSIRDVSIDTKFVSLSGELTDAQRAEIGNVLAESDLKEASLADVRGLLLEQEWISRASVRRTWPDGLTIDVAPEQAIAYWNDDAFINQKGEVFTSQYLMAGEMAHLYGPQESESQVMHQYRELNKILAPWGQSIEVIVFDERGAWEFTTNRGVKVLLGKDNIMDRIQRFLLVVENSNLTEREEDIGQIDTRYGNGVAVSWKKAVESLEVAKTENSQRELRL